MNKFRNELEVTRTVSNNYEIDFSELRQLKKISEGAFGNIYKANWRETVVAVKMIKKEYLNSEVVKDFLSKLNRRVLCNAVS